jgi:hypothetical protein
MKQTKLLLTGCVVAAMSMWWVPGPAPAKEGRDADRVMAKLVGAEDDPNEKRSKAVQAGILDGHPYLRNEQVICLWSKPQQGAGVVRMRDLKSKNALLEIKASKATAWRLGLKTADGAAASRDSSDMPCTVVFDAQAGEGRLSFTWSEHDVQVIVKTRLLSAESHVRSRISIHTGQEGPGLKTVTFPIVEGIAPFTAGAKDDQILDTNAVGDLKPSPLVSGEALSYEYPLASMQFTALLGDGRGLYCAEEDGEANRKFFKWTPDAAGQTLTFVRGFMNQ